MEYQDGTLIVEDGGDVAFLVMDGRLSVIENADIVDMVDAVMVDTAALELLREEGGPAISSDAYLAIVEGKGYLVNNGEKRYFTSEDAIRKYHFNRGKFQDRTTADLPEAAGADLG